MKECPPVTNSSAAGMGEMTADRRMDVVGVLGARWVLSTGIIALVIFSNFVVQRWLNWVPSFILFEVCFAIMTLLIPYMITQTVSASRIDLVSPISELSSLSVEESATWISEQAGAFISGPRPLAIGAVLVAAGFISQGAFGIPWSGMVRILFLLWMGLFFFGVGVLACQYLGLMALVGRLASIQVRPSVFSWPTSLLRRIYRTYFHLMAIAAGVYLIGVASVWLSPGGADIARGTIVGGLWVFPPGATVLFFYFYFHYNLHVVLHRCRDQSEHRLSALLEENFNAWVTAPSEVTERAIEKLTEWRGAVRGEKMSIFDFKTSFAAVVTLLAPTIKEIIGFFA